jgi:Uncharacterized protein conserved in bacteria (DUF2325)
MMHGGWRRQTALGIYRWLRHYRYIQLHITTRALVLVGGYRETRAAMKMDTGGLPIAIRSGAGSPALSRMFDISAIPPRLVARDAPPLSTAPPRRTKIWEFNSNLHCSIIGTCLSTGELRQTLKKLGVASSDCSDHELHGIAVSLAGRQDNAARQLNKALDHRHKLAVSQFAKATSEDELRTLWVQAVRRGEIPGAYWATLTHPATTQAIVREAFGEVHMLSHLVGSANRADIQRLCQLESEKTDLQAKLDRQQLALHHAVVTRDVQISELRQALMQGIVSRPADSQSDEPGECAALRGLITDLEGRLAAATRRRDALDDRLAAAQAEIARERSARLAAERDCETLRRELDAVEASLLPECPATRSEALPAPRLDDITLLYVGGRPHQIAHLRSVVERVGGTFLYHDGGVESHQTLLPGLTSRADLVLFPVDCISHDAALTVKSLCRQGGKRFIPLRSASVASLLTALQGPEVASLSDVAA